MFIIDLQYIAPLESIDASMKSHMAFLKTYYDNKTFIASGRKVPRTGGIILAMAESKEEIESIIKEDPFVKANLAKYTITEFQTSQLSPEMKKALAG